MNLHCLLDYIKFMKRVLLILLGGFILSAPVMAQYANFDTQRGLAIQELNTPGLTAAHPSLPINSRATVLNTVNEREIEVTITRRIPISQERIIDLSFAAWEALELSAGNEVVITRPRVATPVVAAEPQQQPLEAEEPPQQLPPPPQPVEITAPQQQQTQPAATEELQQQSEAGKETQRQVLVIYVVTPQQTAVPPATAPQAVVTPSPAPARQTITRRIEVIPGWPNPNSNKVYRLQVGSYISSDAAARSEQIVRAAGFATRQEMYGSMHRVIALNVPAAEVVNSVNRLAVAGFSQFWIRE